MKSKCHLFVLHCARDDLTVSVDVKWLKTPWNISYKLDNFVWKPGENDTNCLFHVFWILQYYKYAVCFVSALWIVLYCWHVGLKSKCENYLNWFPLFLESLYYSLKIYMYGTNTSTATITCITSAAGSTITTSTISTSTNIILLLVLL